MKCTHCGSEEVTRSGTSRYGGNEYQRYICKSCKRHFVLKKEAI